VALKVLLDVRGGIFNVRFSNKKTLKK